MTTPDFDIGTVVRLKSGGPTMTVARKESHGELQCYWFAGFRRYDSWFLPAMLMEAEADGWTAPNSEDST